MAVDGAETSWQKHFAARARIDCNWKRELPRPSAQFQIDEHHVWLMEVVMNSNLLLLVASGNAPVVIFSRPEGKELRRINVQPKGWSVDNSQSRAQVAVQSLDPN